MPAIDPPRDLATAKAAAHAAAERFAAAEKVFDPRWLTVSPHDPRRLEHAAAFAEKQKADAALLEIERNAAPRQQQISPRQNHAKSIARRGEARADVEKCRALKARADDAIASMRLSVNAAAAAVEVAKASAVDRAVGNSGVTPISLGQARRDLDDRERDLEEFKAHAARCSDQLGKAMGSLDTIQITFNRTRNNVLSEARAALLKSYDADCGRAAAKAALLEMFQRAGGDLPMGWQQRRHAAAVDPEQEKALVAWLAALETDADAPVDELINSLD
jgi:hypothetical protein